VPRQERADYTSLMERYCHTTGASGLVARLALALLLLAGATQVLLPGVATAMQVAQARADAGICSVHAAFLPAGDDGRSQPSHALDCVVCMFAAAGAADTTARPAPAGEMARTAGPRPTRLSAAPSPAFLHPPGQAPPQHAASV